MDRWRGSPQGDSGGQEGQQGGVEEVGGQEGWRQPGVVGSRTSWAEALEAVGVTARRDASWLLGESDWSKMVVLGSPQVLVSCPSDSFSLVHRRRFQAPAAAGDALFRDTQPQAPERRFGAWSARWTVIRARPRMALLLARPTVEGRLLPRAAVRTSPPPASAVRCRDD
jgi:hypothetical protein